VNRIAGTELDVFPLCFGGNVFGWTADEPGSFELLDAYTAAGGNFIDTADSYVEWAPGGEGGESEAIIGHWLARRGRRDELVIATKVGQAPGREGLGAANIAAAADASLRRLGIDHIDLYYAHEDDPGTPLEETMAAFAELVSAGKVRHVAASNHTAPRLAAALETSDRMGVPRYVGVQTHYNLVHRDEYEAELAPLCARERLSVLAYSALADGFLTGKYRPGHELPQSERADDAAPYLDARGVRVLEALDSVASHHEAPVAAVALAWLTAQPTVAAAVASARTVGQLQELLVSATLRLDDDDLRLLGDASA
jgi:aryl-alcohol dehydrogenase-like predicted oxidoreductase